MEIRIKDDGTLDEIVGEGSFHIERMANDAWYLRLGDLKLNLWRVGNSVLAGPLEEPSWRIAKMNYERR